MVKRKIRAVEIDDEEFMSVNAVLANPRNLSKKVDVKFVIDTGAGMTAITEAMAKKLDLKYVAQAQVGLADGSIVDINLAYIYLDIRGERVFALVGCGGCDVALLGFDILGLLQLQLDIANKKILKPLNRRFKILSVVWRVPSLHGLG